MTDADDLRTCLSVALVRAENVREYVIAARIEQIIGDLENRVGRLDQKGNSAWRITHDRHLKLENASPGP